MESPAPAEQSPAPARSVRARRAAGRRRGAVLVSLAVHAALAVAIHQVRNPPPSPAPDLVELIVVSPAPVSPAPVSPTPVSPAAVPPAHLGGPAETSGAVRAGPLASRPISGKRSRPPNHGEARPPETDGRTVPTTETTPSAESPADLAATAERLSTLLPARPDLSAARHLGDVGAQRRDLLAAPSAGRKSAPASELPRVLEGGGGVTADVAEDGTIRFRDAKNLGYDAKAWSGRFDLTDAVMRKTGQDPYAAAKRKLAEETREQRFCMAKQAHEKWQSEALLELSAKVRQIAGRLDLSPVERRRVVFEIWDECTEGPGDSALDYAGMARATILAAIRDVFPAGSDLAYQPTELVALNRHRSSHESFAPYAPTTARRHSGTGGALGSTSCP